MTITNLPSYLQYITPQYPLAPPSQVHHSHHVHPAHPHAHHHHHQTQTHTTAAYAHHPHSQHQHQHHSHPQTHVLTGPIRSDPITRKRPKYTRSKTGCLTCRVKKIKCDETKPTCTRCAHGQRECTWPENVPPRKKPAVKKPSEQADVDRNTTHTPESASPSSTSPPIAREASPVRKSPVGTLSVPEGNLLSRRPHSEPTTAVGSPMASPTDTPNSFVPSRRPRYMRQSPLSHTVLPYRPTLSLPQNIHSPSSVPYTRHPYPALTPPSVSPASFHPSPSSSHEYSSYNSSPVSNGHASHHPAAIPRHDLPSLHSGHTRLPALTVEPAHSLGQWHSGPPLIPPTVGPIEPFFRTIQERNFLGRSPASYAS